METAQVTYVDSTLFIAAAVYSNEIGKAALNFVFNHPQLVTADSTFIEALRSITRRMGKEQAIWMCEKFARLTNLSILAGNAQISAQLIQNYHATGLSPSLSMHLAYMQVNGITQIASLDPAFDKISGIKRVKL